MNQQANDESAWKVERPVRRVVYALAALFVLAIGVLFVLNAVAASRIRRINDRGGLVKSWSPILFEPLVRPFGGGAMGWFEDVYVVRQRYEVYFGDLDIAVGCGSGVTLWLRPEADFDSGDSDLEAAKDLRGIQLLSLLHTTVTDAGLQYLPAMREIEHLDLGWTQVKGPGLEHLRGIPLQSLSLHGAPIDDAGFEHLPELPLLRSLDLGDTRITALGLGRLQHYRQLTSLDLSGTPVTDDIVRDLGTLSIEYLNLRNTAITDAALASLEKMPHLRNVHLCDTGVTTEAASRSSSDVVRGWVSTREGLCRHLGHNREH